MEARKIRQAPALLWCPMKMIVTRMQVLEARVTPQEKEDLLMLPLDQLLTTDLGQGLAGLETMVITQKSPDPVHDKFMREVCLTLTVV